MSANYSLLFYLKKPKNYVSGAKPIYMRITINGSVCEISTGKNCDPNRWNSKANRSKGNTEEVKTLNSYLETLNLKVAAIHLEILKMGETPTIELLKAKITGKVENQKRLLTVLKDHNHKMDILLGNGFRENTLKGYKNNLLAFRKLYFKRIREYRCNPASLSGGGQESLLVSSH